MDSLLAEINSKRKQLEDVPESGPSKRYMKRGDIEAAKEAAEAAKKQAEEERRERLRAESKAVKARREVRIAHRSSHYHFPSCSLTSRPR
jgi:hypothetical protein